MRSRLGIGPSPLADEPAVHGGEELSPAVVQTGVSLDCVNDADRHCPRPVPQPVVARVGRQLVDGDTKCVRDRDSHREDWLALPSLVAPDLSRVHSCGGPEVGLGHAKFGSASAYDFGHLHGPPSSRTFPPLDNRTYMTDSKRQYMSAVLGTEESAQRGGDSRQRPRADATCTGARHPR